jgi:hypothetical protein
VVQDRVAKRFGNLVAEAFVGSVIASHGALSLAQLQVRQGQRRAGHVDWPSP